jgi:hypothetical protein
MVRRAVPVLALVSVLSLVGCGDDDDSRPVATATPTTIATATAVASPTEPPAATATSVATATLPPTATVPPVATITPTSTTAPTSTPTEPPAAPAYAAQACAAAKQAAAGRYCQAVFDEWANWERVQDDLFRDGAIVIARQELADDWAAAEATAQAAGVDCADQALSAAAVAEIVDPAASAAAAAVNGGLNVGDEDDANCGAALLGAAADRCAAVLAAESRHVGDLVGDRDGSRRDADTAAAGAAFSAEWTATTAAGCATTATEAGVAALVDTAAARLVLDTIVAPGVTAGTYTTISPTGSIEYLGKTLTPVCMDGSPYHFFVRRGTVNKLVMYYQGGGACWEGLTCALPTCDSSVEPTGSDNPNDFSSGFADLDNPANPFRDWHSVIVSYCSCDIHFGDAARDYETGNPQPLHVEHRGFHNAGVAEKWAREHFVNPEQVFVTGSSAGAYGAWFNAVPLQRAWPASRFDVVADAGNGVITEGFLTGPFANWDFTRNLPDDIPGVRESIEDRTGIVGYTEAVTRFFPDTDWAHYTTAFDGGGGGQTGFYNIMLHDNFPLAALTWWEASCAFTTTMRQQAVATAAAVPDNYRYYIGTGSRHTMWGANKVYDDTTGGVPTIADWVTAMLANRPGSADPGWTNVECENCGLLLPGDPRPSPLEAPFEQIGDDVVIVCE